MRELKPDYETPTLYLKFKYSKGGKYSTNHVEGYEILHDLEEDIGEFLDVNGSGEYVLDYHMYIKDRTMNPTYVFEEIEYLG